MMLSGHEAGDWKTEPRTFDLCREEGGEQLLGLICGRGSGVEDLDADVEGRAVLDPGRYS